MNQNLISLLREKKIATKLENIDQVNKLTQILLTTFPKDNFLNNNPTYLKLIFKDNKIFSARTNTVWWCYMDTTTLPIIPIEHFFLTINDVCLEGSKTLKQFFIDNNIYTYNYNCNEDLYYYVRENTVDFTSIKPSRRFTLITEDQFKMYFSQKQITPTLMEKKQIGWKISKPEYNKAALQIADCSEWNNHEWDFAVNSEAEIKLIKAEVLELWCTPVYEKTSKDKEFTLICTDGAFNVKVCKEGIKYLDNKIFSIIQLKLLISPYSSIITPNGYPTKVYVSHIDIGCKKRIPIEDIQRCIDYWEENFK